MRHLVGRERRRAQLGQRPERLRLAGPQSARQPDEGHPADRAGHSALVGLGGLGGVVALSGRCGLLGLDFLGGLGLRRFRLGLLGLRLPRPRRLGSASAPRQPPSASASAAAPRGGLVRPLSSASAACASCIAARRSAAPLTSGPAKTSSESPRSGTSPISSVPLGGSAGGRGRLDVLELVLHALDAEREAAALGVDLEDLHAHGLAGLDDLARVLHVVLGELGDVHEALDPVHDLHEGAEGDDLGDLALELVAPPMCLFCAPPSGPWQGRRAFLLAAGAAAATPSLAQVDVGKSSVARNLVPAENIEQAGAQQYGDLLKQARAKGALAPDGNPQLQRLRAIAARIIPFASQWNPRAAQWKWEVNLIGSKQINAFCMPGGKIAFFTGILDQLKLDDDEVAMVMGHEMAHALREHAREQLAKSAGTGAALSIGSQLLGLGQAGDLAAGPARS